MKFTAILKLSLLGIAGVVALSPAAFGQESRHDAGATGQVAADSRPTIKLLAVENDAKELAALTAGGASATFGSLSLTVQVDPTYCATGGVQCTGPALPADNNRNPVRLGLQVLDGAGPVTTVTDADVSVFNPFVPAGGSSVSQLACATCFQNGGNGLYTIFVNPVLGQTWKPGSYFVQIRVTVGARTHRALAQIEIPF